MNRSFIGRVTLTLALITGLAGSALSSDAGKNLATIFNPAVDRLDITALIFEPAQSDAMGEILRNMHLTSMASDTSGHGQYVLDATGTTDVITMLLKYGKVARQLRQRVSLGDDGRASAFSSWPERQFSASLKTRYIPSVKNSPAAFIMDYSLKASLERPLPGVGMADDSAQLRYASGGSVLLPDKGALISISQTSDGFLIWIISAK